MSSVPARCCGLVGDDADGRPVEAAERGHEVRRVLRPELEERVVVDDVADDGAHVVGSGRPVRAPRSPPRSHAPVARVVGRRSAADRRGGGRGGRRGCRAARRARLLLVVDDERGDAALARVHAAPPSSSRVTCTPVNSVDRVGPGDERERVVGHHDDVEAARARAPGPTRTRRSPRAASGLCPRRARPRARACPTRAARRRARAARHPTCRARRRAGCAARRRVAPPARRSAPPRDADRAVVLPARDAEPHDLPAVDLAQLRRRRDVGAGVDRRRPASSEIVERHDAGAKISVTLWPPNPNEFDSAGAGASGARRARARRRGGCRRRAARGSRSAGPSRSRIASRHATASVAPAAPIEVAGDALGRRDRRCGVAEHLADRLGLGRVVERRRRAVRVHVPDLRRRRGRRRRARAACTRPRLRRPATAR